MKLQEAKKRFESGKIDKWQYIDEMYGLHAQLFDYADFLGQTNISDITIEDGKVIMTFRDSKIRFICEKEDKRLATFETLNFGAYEIEELNMQLKLINSNYNVFDIGGNFGWYALHAAQKLTDGKVYTFEPIPGTFEKLVGQIRLNNFNNIQAYKFGFSDTEGTFDFYFDPSLSVNASLSNVANNSEIQVIKCETRTLDNFVSELGIKVDFIKCDVEGAELLVFKGSIETLIRDKPIIFSEMLRKWTAKFNYHPNEIIDLLGEIGYKCYTIDFDKLRPLEGGNVSETTIETNFIFLHSENHKSQINEFVIRS